MSSLDALAPDQRAVVVLVLQQGRSYEDIADVLGIPVAAVRARAHAGLRALAPTSGLPDEITGPLADYLLGRQSPSDAEATRGLLAESAPARTWAAGVARSLEPDAPGGLPEVPGGGEAPTDERAADEVPGGEEPTATMSAAERGAGEAPGVAAAGAPAYEAATAPAAAAPAHEAPPMAPAAPPIGGRPAAGELPPDAAPQASRLGGIVLIGGVLAVVAIVVVFVVRGGSGDEQPVTPAAVATATPTPTATATRARITDRIPLSGVGGSTATGRMLVFVQDNQLLFQLRARNVPPNGRRSAYAVWFTGPGGRARRLGYTDPVGKNGRLGIQGPSDADLGIFPQLYANYAEVVVSRETNAAARRPANPVLRGQLPKGR